MGQSGVTGHVAVIWNNTSWLEFCKARECSSTSPFAKRIPLLMGTWGSGLKAVTGAMLICYHGDHSGNIQTFHQSRQTSASFWLPEGFLGPYSHQFKVHFFKMFGVWLLNVITSLRGGRGWQVSQDFKAMKFTYDNYSLGLSYRRGYGITGHRAWSQTWGGVLCRTAYYLLTTCHTLLEQHPVHDIIM